MPTKRLQPALGRPKGGSEAVVRRILAATLGALEADGIAGLRVEDIARVAGVNKTSVYRRWPSKGELVRAALGTTSEDEPSLAEIGDLREDLIALLAAKAARVSTSRGRRIMRALMAFDDDGAALTAALREHRHARLRDLLTRAIEQGELPSGSDAGFLTELLIAPILHRILILNGPVAPVFIQDVVDHVLAGVRGALRATRPSRPRRRKQL